MASLPGHAVAAIAIASALRPRGERPPPRYWLVAMGCAMAPDADVAGVGRVPYESFWGHRGITHSLFAAACVGAIGLLFALLRCDWRVSKRRLYATFALCAASHGVLDAMTNGGRGVAFFSPFDTTRYFLPWRPILVSPIGVDGFLSARGLAILANEALWIGVPALAIIVLATIRRSRAERLPPTPR